MKKSNKNCGKKRDSRRTVEICNPSFQGGDEELDCDQMNSESNPDGSVATNVQRNERTQSNPKKEATTSGSDNWRRLMLLYGIVVLQLTIFITELITDQFTHSLLILTDAYHHLFNACNAILLVLSFKISNQVTVKNTFGWVRVEVLGMLTTITFIVALIFSLLIEGALQLLHLHEISTPTNFNVLLIFGAWSLIVNLFYVLIINGMVTEKKYKQTTRTERSFSTAKCEQPSGSGGSSSGSDGCSPSSSACRENDAREIVDNSARRTARISSDSNNNSNRNNNNNNNNGKKQQQQQQQNSQNNLSTIVVSQTSDYDRAFDGDESDDGQSSSSRFAISLLQGSLSPAAVLLASAAIILAPDPKFAHLTDPSIGIVTAILLCISFFPQLKNTMLILMQTVPENVNIAQMKKKMLAKFEMIENIHELHIWRLTAANIVATCHIVLREQPSTAQYCGLFARIKTFLRTQYGIVHVTIQPEFIDWQRGDARTGSKHNNNNNNNNRRLMSAENKMADDRANIKSDECLMKCPQALNECGGVVTDCDVLTCCNHQSSSRLDSVHVQHAHGHGHFH